MDHALLPVYFAGFEVGSGISGLKIIPADGLTVSQDLVTLPSFIADGDITLLLKGGDLDASLSTLLKQDDYVITWQDHTYFLGQLLEQGTHSGNAFNIEDSIQRVARPLSSFLAGIWNVEEASAGTQFDSIYLGGGGAYYFQEIIRSTLSDCHVVTVPDPQDANIQGYAELAASLDEDRWEVNEYAHAR